MGPLKHLARAAALACAALLSHATVAAAVVYDNTITDTLFTYVYSANGVSEIGDTVTLAPGTDRVLTDVQVQFFNLGVAAGSFDAILRFYGVPALGLVGSRIGADYSVLGATISGLDVATVSFTHLNLLVPDSFVFTVQVPSGASGLDLGLNAFDPPAIGSSDISKLVLGGGTTFSDGGPGLTDGNLYFLANAAPVPEASSMLMLTAGALLVLQRVRRRGPGGPAAR